MKGAIRGMRNAKKSWHKSDSKWSSFKGSEYASSVAIPEFNRYGEVYELGEADLKLAKSLVASGTDHRKFLRQIFVSMDIFAPSYWWRQYATYKVGTTENSTSQMHTITNREYTRNDFSEISKKQLDKINNLVKLYQKTKSLPHKKEIKQSLIEKMPPTYIYQRTVSSNYEVLRNQYTSRRVHFLDEWKEYCNMLEHFPYSVLLTLNRAGGVND